MITRRGLLALLCMVLGCSCSAAAFTSEADHVSRLSVPLFLQIGAASFISQGVFISPSGATIPFCSANGCYPGQHLAAQMLVNMTTNIDASAQEVAIYANVTSRTGRAERWRPGAPYPKGSQVQSTNGSLYESVRAGRSGPSAPQGHGQAIIDGSVEWAFRSDVVHNGKTALGAGLNMVRGSGQGWALVSDLTVQPGVGDQNAFGYENDCANYNKDSDFGVPFLMTCFFQGGQGAGTFPMFAYRYVAAGDGSRFGAHFGDFFNGAHTIKDATIADATNAQNVIRATPGTSHGSTFLDGSSSTHSVEISGTFRSAIDLSQAKTTDAQIAGRSWMVDPSGHIEASGFRSALEAPKTSSDPCAPGTIRYGEDFIYVCASPNRWRRAPLEAW